MENRIRDKVKVLLLASGWTEDEILEEQSISEENRVYRPDIVLVNNLNPLAVVEIKGTKIDESDIELKNQVLDFLDALNVPVGFISNFDKLYQISSARREIEGIKKFPKPSEIWEQFFSKVLLDSPYRIPPLKVSLKPPRLFQIEAINRAISSIQNGNQRIRIELPQGSGKSYIALQICWKLIKSKVIKRVVFLSDKLEVGNNLRNLFSKYDWRVSDLQINSEELKGADIYFMTIQKALHSVYITKLINSETLIIVESDRNWDKHLGELASDAIVLLFSSTRVPWDVSKQFPVTVFTYTISEAIKDNLLSPLEGFGSHKLDEIADIRMGVPVDIIKEANAGELIQVKVVRGRDLKESGKMDFNQLMIVPKKLDKDGLPERSNLLTNDILISTTPSKGDYSVFLLSGKVPANITFATSVIRIRVKQDLANPKNVYTYLKSDAGQSAIKLLAVRGGTSIPRLIPSGLSQIPISLPLIKSTKTSQTELSTFAQIKQQLQEKIIPNLDILEGEPHDSSNLENLAEHFRQIANILAPLPLPDRILKSYPMPIALALRRYKDSRFNVYEQVMRLRDVFEATAFYIYNIVLADAFHRLDPKTFFVQDKGARRAYNGYSMSARLDFVDAIVDTAKKYDPNHLFMPELLNTTFVEQTRELQEKFRNRLSHSATAAESQQHKILNEFDPVVMNVLSELEFITKYRLVRIPSFHFQDGQWRRRMEIYHGVVPEIDEQTVQNTEGLISADKNHLVLLNEEDQPLCLHPLYQLKASYETRNEIHLCFIKYRKKALNILVGESVQGAFEIELDDSEQFDSLQNRILDSI